jgi:hypothetical protein
VTEDHAKFSEVIGQVFPSFTIPTPEPALVEAITKAASELGIEMSQYVQDRVLQLFYRSRAKFGLAVFGPQASSSQIVSIAEKAFPASG